MEELPKVDNFLVGEDTPSEAFTNRFGLLKMIRSKVDKRFRLTSNVFTLEMTKEIAEGRVQELVFTSGSSKAQGRHMIIELKNIQDRPAAFIERIQVYY